MLTNNEQHECIVCTESLDQLLPCGHAIHTRCIARSGQNTCSVCRREVTFESEDNTVYQEAIQRNEQERIQREQNESIALARQLQRQLRTEPEEPVERRYVTNINGTTFRINPTNVDGVLDVGDCMLQVNQLMYNISNRQRQFDCDMRVFNLYRVIMQLNEVSAETGLSITQLCSVIENTQ
jgi:hypothetical protein